MWVVRFRGLMRVGNETTRWDFGFEQFIDDFVMKKTLKYHLMNYVLAEKRRQQRNLIPLVYRHRSVRKSLFDPPARAQRVVKKVKSSNEIWLNHVYRIKLNIPRFWWAREWLFLLVIAPLCTRLSAFDVDETEMMRWTFQIQFADFSLIQ